MATSAEDPERRYPINHGLKISCVRECARGLAFPLVSHILVQDKDLVFEDAMKEFTLAFSTVKTGRSLAVSYNLQNDIQCRYRVDLSG